MTPFQALYGRPPPPIPAYQGGLSLVNEVDQSFLSRDELLKQLKTNLEVSINRMKQVADRKRREVTFDVGDMVFLRLQPYRQQSTFKRVHQKLAAQFYGPYPIVQKLGAVAYKLQLPEGSRIHPVFHVSLLKKFVGEHPAPSKELPPVSDGVILLEPQCILETRWVKHGSTFVEESLVQWKHLPAEEATWENTQVLRNQFSNVDLEDKSPPEGGNNDKTRKSERQPKPNPKYRE